MIDHKRALERIGDRVAPSPEGWDRLLRHRQRRSARGRVAAAVLALLIAGVGLGSAYFAFYRSGREPMPGGGFGETSDGTPARCETLIPDCQMDRLPNRVLTGDGRIGALGPVGQVPEGVISFDEALIRAWTEDGQQARAVQVVLGSAESEATALGQ